MSRRPKPTAVKKRTGNPGRRPLNTREPEFAGVTTSPAWLDKTARAEWRRLAPTLGRQRLLTPADRAAFAAYCAAYSRLVRAERFLQSKTARGALHVVTLQGGVKPWPEVAIANAAADQMRKLAVEFGFTPASRSKIQVDGAGAKSNSNRFLFGVDENRAECDDAPN